MIPLILSCCPTSRRLLGPRKMKVWKSGFRRTSGLTSHYSCKSHVGVSEICYSALKHDNDQYNIISSQYRNKRRYYQLTSTSALFSLRSTSMVRVSMSGFPSLYSSLIWSTSILPLLRCLLRSGGFRSLLFFFTSRFVFLTSGSCLWLCVDFRYLLERKIGVKIYWYRNDFCISW